MANNVSITGSDFSELYNALDKVAKRSAQAARFMSRMFNTDFTNGRVFASFDKLSTSIDTSITKVNALKAALKGVSDGVRMPSMSPNVGNKATKGASKTSDFVPSMRVESNAIAYTQDFMARNQKMMDRLRSANEMARKAQQQQEDKRAKLLGREGSDVFVGPPKDAFKQSEKSIKDAFNAQAKLQREKERADRQMLAEQNRANKAAERQAVTEQRNAAREKANADKQAAREKANAERTEARNAKSRYQQYSSLGGMTSLIRADQMLRLIESAQRRAFNLKTNFSNVSSPSNSMISKFGNPGQMPLFSRFRVFQRPFPGSERNPFALGDAGNLYNNAIYGAFTGVRQVFDTITTAGNDVVRLFSGVAQTGISFGAALLNGIPVIGQFAGSLTALIPAISKITEAFTGFVDKLSQVVGQAITAIGTLALGASGFAYRAVQAASDLTELKNAANIYVGSGGKQLNRVASAYQSEYGLSATDSLRLMTRVAGQLRQTTGVSSETAATQAETIFKAVADAGSVLNMGLDDIGKIVQSGLAGRYTPFRRIGVNVTAPYLDEVARQKGYTATAKTPMEARIKALYDELIRQTKPFLKDLEATQYEFANQRRKILGQFENMFVQLGRILEPFGRVVLIASNAIADVFVKKLAAFGNMVEDAVEMAKNKVQGPTIDGGWVTRSIEYFARAAAFASNVILEFAAQVWASRYDILEYAKMLGNSLVDLAASLLSYSSRMIATLANVTTKFLGLIPSLSSFGDALITMSKYVDRWFGENKVGKSVQSYDASMNLAEEYDRRVKMFNKGIYEKSGPPDPKFGMPTRSRATREEAALDAKSMLDRLLVDAPRRDAITDLINKGMSKEDAVVQVDNMGQFKGVGDSFMKTAQDLATSLAIQAETVKREGFGAIKIPNVPERVSSQSILDKIYMAMGRTPEFTSPVEMMGTKKMSEYMSPAAYRDEVMTRELDAAETTAQNTTAMASSLQTIASVIGGAGMSHVFGPVGAVAAVTTR